MKNVKKSIVSCLANAVTGFAAAFASVPCLGVYYEANVPKELSNDQPSK